MATYIHYEVANSPITHWEDVLGTSYTFNASLVTFTNSDGTKTKAHGSFIIINGNLIDGNISSLEHTAANGVTVYESITGLSKNFNQFVSYPVEYRLRQAFDGSDTLYGFSGKDYLDGGNGHNVMIGGKGDDYYVAGGDIIENPNGGADTVELRSGNFFHMPDNVENMVAVGNYGIGYGNGLDNAFEISASKGRFFGGDGTDKFTDVGEDNWLEGGLGDDVYYMNGYGSWVSEAPDEGYDTVYTSQNMSLEDNVERLEFIGSASHRGWGNDGDNDILGGTGQDFLWGFDGEDLLFGRGGKDVLIGGKGDDRYSILDGDSIVELADEGIDMVFVTAPIYKLPEHVENMQFTGETAYGNDLDNVIQLNGGGPRTYLYGLKGNDTFHIGGSDTIWFYGGEGDDTVVGSINFTSFKTVDDYGAAGAMSFDTGSAFVGATGIEHFKFADGTIDVNDGSGVFDTLYYMHNNPDVYHAGMNALDHYNAIGWKEGRDPNAWFDTSFYLTANPDVAASGMNPLDHYHQVGWKEGRDPSADFDTTRYLLENPDVAAAGIDPLEHYLQSGRSEWRTAYEAIGQNITGGFDAQYYLFHNPDVAAAGIDPLFHFNVVGWKEGRDPNAWFDSDGYLAHYADVAAAGINPLQHYEAVGWMEGRDPSAGFDTTGYLAAYPDVAAAGMNPLDHFLQFGIYEGRHAVNDGVWG